jgi:transposase InsO family protein
VVGPLPTSDGGNRYFVTFIDDASRYTQVFHMKSKSEVLEKFKIFQRRSERRTGNSIAIIRSDNGGEYISGKFEQYLEDCGIDRQLTVRHTPSRMVWRKGQIEQS